MVTYSDYAVIEAKLREKGFVNDIESGIICRYKINGIIVDVMPTGVNVLGFCNKWYTEGFANSIEYELSPGEKIRIFNPVYFLASKIEAYNNRGQHDGRTSTDFEDIVYILNNRNAIWDEMLAAPDTGKTYLKNELNSLLNSNYIHEWISAHLEHYEQRRVGFIVAGLGNFCES